MNKCSHCGVEILDRTEHCPLCHTVLDELQEGETVYPNVYHRTHKMNFVFRLFLFLCIVAAVVVVFVNYMMDTTYAWSVFVVAAEFYGLLLLYQFSKDDTGYRVRIMTGLIGAVLLIILLDCILGYSGWSVNYVFPAAMILADGAVLLLMLINRRNWQSYLIFQVGMVLVGGIGVIFCLVGWIRKPLFSVIAFAISVLIFLGTVILGGRTAKNELRRRFHIR